MALIHTLLRLKDDGLVTNFDMLEEQKARVRFFNGDTLVVFMAKDYIVGVTAIKEAMASDPIPNYIVYNHWDRVTPEARREAERLGIPLVSYAEFRRIVERLE